MKTFLFILISFWNQDNTCYVGNLDEKAGPVVNVYLPKDRVTMLHQGYGFVEFNTEEDADYAIRIMNMVKLYGKPIRVNKASSDRKNLDIGATLFVGGLDPEVDEKMLYDTFSQFGQIVQPPKIAREPESGVSKGYGFVSFDNFESSDAAIEALNGQFLMNKTLNVNYGFKKDGKGERHGSAAERLLAAQMRKQQASQPNRMFANVAPAMGMPGQPPFAAAAPAMPAFGGAPPAMYPAQQSYPPAGYPQQPPAWGYAG